MATPFVPYHPGTVQVTNGGKAIVGTGTNFLAYDQYDVLIVDGYWVLLDTITDATHATGKFNYLGGSGSGKAYEWVPQSDVTKALTLFQSLSAAFTSGNVQALAGLSSAADKLAYFTGIGTMDVTDFKAASRTLLGKANEAAMLTYLGGQPLDPDLAAIAALATSANKLLGLDASGNWSLSPKQTSLMDTTTGAALTVGSFGVGNATVVTNLDTAGPGDFVANAATAIGAPSGATGAAFGRTSHGSNFTSTRQQVLHVVDSGLSYRRYYTGSEWGPWRLIFDQASILGTVSQSSGVPTGAIIERGSNANGEYVRSADGTQICFSLAKTFSYLSTSALQTSWTFPSAFSEVPALLGSIKWDTGAGAISAGSYANYPGSVSIVSVSSTAGGDLRVPKLSGPSFASGDSVAGYLVAIGRWF
ncbi:MAG TPA: pyocin knob domain-containing protein [Pseudolabrys sp.]|nr:pyocin knob domain-containing protein [Pseudolabrys sp.]